MGTEYSPGMARGELNKAYSSDTTNNDMVLGIAISFAKITVIF